MGRSPKKNATSSRDRAPKDELGAERMRIAHYGLGPIGREIAKLVQQRLDMESVAAIDRDRELVGHDLSQVLGKAAPASVIVTNDAMAALMGARPDVVVLCTGSTLAEVQPQIIGSIKAGCNVVSTCEELAYPWESEPDLVRQIDMAARNAGVTVLGTGVNPGFAMDFLPIVLSGALRTIDKVTIHRTQDAAGRRLQLQRKAGVGLSVGEFAEMATEGKVGHVGLRQSAAAIAAAFGWSPSDVNQELTPVVTDTGVDTIDRPLKPGSVAGVRQTLVASQDGRPVIDMTLELVAGTKRARDEIEFAGDPPLRFEVPGGLHGDVVTAAIVVNSIRSVKAGTPGLQTMAGLAPPRYHL